MIFKIDKGFVPETYYESKDYRVFLKLLSILVSVMKSNIDSFPSLYSPDDCPDNMVNLVASMVGYKYNSSLSVEDNRIIIKYFPYMIRYRGSEEGIKLATALSFNTSEESNEVYTLDNISIEYDYNLGLIKIFCPRTDLLRKDLIEAVRPVGSFVKLIKSSVSDSTDEIDIKATVKAEIEKYDNRREKVDESKVGFGNTDSERKGTDQNDR